MSEDSQKNEMTRKCSFRRGLFHITGDIRARRGASDKIGAREDHGVHRDLYSFKTVEPKSF